MSRSLSMLVFLGLVLTSVGHSAFAYENSVGIKFALIPAGKFTMGSPVDEKDRIAHENQHEVEITRDFYLGTHEVTIGQFRKFVAAEAYKTDAEKDGEGGFGYNEGTGKFEGRKPQYTWKNSGWKVTDDHPVVNVSWNDAKAFCAWLSRQEKKTYRLPTEAEWEYACRAGSKTAFHNGDDPERLAQVGNVADATAKAALPNLKTAIAANDGFVFTAPVGSFQKNAFGMFDMHGNVWEWCEDFYDTAKYSNETVRDPTGSAPGKSHAFRGGSWDRAAGRCRSAARGGNVPTFRNFILGFRVVLDSRGEHVRTARADDFVIVQAEDPSACSVEGRVETHMYPRSVGRKMAMLHPGARLTTTTEMANASIILPPVFEAPGPRYGNFLKCRLRVRVDDKPWQVLTLVTARSETILAENLPPGKRTIAVEPVDGVVIVDAFRFTKKPMAGLTGTVVATDYSELLTDVRADLFQGEQLVRTEYVRSPRSGGFEILGMEPGSYRLRIRAAGWIDVTLAGLKIKEPGHRLDIGVVMLARDPKCFGAQDLPSPRFGHTASVAPDSSFTAMVNLPAPIKGARLRSRFKSFELVVADSRKLPLGRWNDVGETTFQVPKNIPWDMYDLVLKFATKQGEVLRISGQAVCVRPPLEKEFHVAGCGHMNTWGQQTAEYLTRVAEVAELAGARILLVANEVNAAYISGALSELRIPYVVSQGNHTMSRWGDFYGGTSRAHDDGPMRIVEFGRWPYESWEEVHALFRNRPAATNRVVVCYEGFAPIALIREQKINLLFDAHSDSPHADLKDFPPRTFHMRAPTQETLRWIPMTHDGIAAAVKTNSDVPVLSIPRTGPAPLRVALAFPNDGTLAEQVATITNEYPTEFPHARTRLVLRRGVYRITGGSVLQTFDSDDGTRTILDFDIRVPAKSTVAIRAALNKG